MNALRQSARRSRPALRTLILARARRSHAGATHCRPPTADYRDPGPCGARLGAAPGTGGSGDTWFFPLGSSPMLKRIVSRVVVADFLPLQIGDVTLNCRAQFSVALPSSSLVVKRTRVTSSNVSWSLIESLSSTSPDSRRWRDAAGTTKPGPLSLIARISASVHAGGLDAQPPASRTRLALPASAIWDSRGFPGKRGMGWPHLGRAGILDAPGACPTSGIVTPALIWPRLRARYKFR